MHNVLTVCIQYNIIELRKAKGGFYMTNINIRIDENVKKQATELFEDLGLDMSTAMNLFLRQAIRYGGIPFDIRKPNDETMKAIDEVNQIRAGKLKAKRYKNTNDLFADLDG